MTPQPKEGITADGVYVVTEKMLQKIELRDGVLLDELRSRPAPQQPETFCPILNDKISNCWKAQSQPPVSPALAELLDRVTTFADEATSTEQQYAYQDVIKAIHEVAAIQREQEQQR